MFKKLKHRFILTNMAMLSAVLLSVEQMSNGVLYAIWAIPVALSFLGIGAGVSRRAFAKHQVS